MTEKRGERRVKLINQRVWCVSLFLLIFPVFSASFAAAQDGLLWWKSKAENRHAAVSLKSPERLVLRWGRFQRGTQDGRAVGRAVKSDVVKAWIRSPGGAVSKANLSTEKGTMALDFPSKLNPAELNGLYLACTCVDAGFMDINLDGRDERVHYYAKYLICRWDEDGIQGKRPDVFFKDAEKIPLEIGPLVAPATGEEASCAEVGCQEARKRHRMKVLYNEKPLAEARVAFLTENGWGKMLKTDAEGTFSILPVEEKQKAERCLYAVTYKDPSTGEYHCSSLAMVITAPPPRWMSRAGGFDFWAAVGSGLFIVYVTAAVYRKVRRDKKTMLEFESRRIRRD